MGAFVALEATRLAEQSGAAVSNLVISGSNPLSVDRLLPRQATDDESLLGWLVELGGIEPEVAAEPELIEFILPLVKADLDLIETYDGTETSRVVADLLVIYGRNDQLVDPESLAGWSRYSAEGRAEVVEFPGNHFYLGNPGPELLSRLAELVQDTRK